MHQFDYIIVGSGLAGLYSSYRASRYGKVALVTKSGIRESNSYFAQGGIAAVTDEKDTPKFHLEDTIAAGRGLCDYDAVNILVNEGPERIHELIDDGMVFDMYDGSLALGLEGGHHRRRILHAGGDVTGKKITDFMIDKVTENPNISIFENHYAIEVLKSNGKCCGVRTWDLAGDCEDVFLGNHTILTLGGASAIFRNTTNPRTTTGDGVALAYRAHCLLQDMEFIQFHPTAIFTENDKSYLISEAVRGEGAYLLNENGERFMTAIHESAELAPRDIVARSIYKQILNQEKPYVYLSLKHLNPERIKERFPNIFEKCRQLGIDMTDKIPVAPAAHYMVGGVRTDSYGQTNLPGLYVCGELASTGIMGANRLASNSLLECLVFGYRAVEECERDSFESKENVDNNGYSPLYIKDSRRQNDFTNLRCRVSEIMTVHAGIIRNDQLLCEGLCKLEKERENFVRGTKEIFDRMGENLIIVAELIIRSAINRRESRGGHFREDYPTEDKSFIHHIVQQKGEEIFTISVNENTGESL